MDLTKFKQESDELKKNLTTVAEYLNKISSTIPEINNEVKQLKSAYSSDYLNKMANLKNEMTALKGIDKNAKDIMQKVATSSMNDIIVRLTAIEAGTDKNNTDLQALLTANAATSRKISELLENLTQASMNDMTTRMDALESTLKRTNARIKSVEDLVLSNNQAIAELSSVFQSLVTTLDKNSCSISTPDNKVSANNFTTKASIQESVPLKDVPPSDDKAPLPSPTVTEPTMEATIETTIKATTDATTEAIPAERHPADFLQIGKMYEDEKQYGLAVNYYLRGANQGNKECLEAAKKLIKEDNNTNPASLSDDCLKLL